MGKGVGNLNSVLSDSCRLKMEPSLVIVFRDVLQQSLRTLRRI
jgi:hypothetical protein